jgi:hypothetical protein
MKSLATAILTGILLVSFAAPALARGFNDPSCDGDGKKGEEEKKKEKNPSAF